MVFVRSVPGPVQGSLYALFLVRLYALFPVRCLGSPARGPPPGPRVTLRPPPAGPAGSAPAAQPAGLTRPGRPPDAACDRGPRAGAYRLGSGGGIDSDPCRYFVYHRRKSVAALLLWRPFLISRCTGRVLERAVPGPGNHWSNDLTTDQTGAGEGCSRPGSSMLRPCRGLL
jgi:hypothetical protein